MFGKRKPIEAYILVEQTNVENMRHVSILLENVPVVGTVKKTLDLDLTNRDIESVNKLLDQLNANASDNNGLNDVIRFYFKSK